MPDLRVKVKCPKCSFIIKARLESFRDFIIYQCPGCKSNVAVMDNKVMVISKDLFKKLVNRGIFETCGNLKPMNTPKTKEKFQDTVHSISKDDILNLRILLETETDFDKILSKL